MPSCNCSPMHQVTHTHTHLHERDRKGSEKWEFSSARTTNCRTVCAIFRANSGGAIDDNSIPCMAFFCKSLFRFLPYFFFVVVRLCAVCWSFNFQFMCSLVFSIFSVVVVHSFLFVCLMFSSISKVIHYYFIRAHLCVGIHATYTLYVELFVDR